MGKKLGLAANLYVMTSGTRAAWATSATSGVYTAVAPTGLVLVGGVKDLGIDLEKQDVDASDRDSQGWAGSIGALRKGPVTFKLNWNSTDAGQLALLQCFLGSGQFVGCAALDGPELTTGASGLWFDAEVMKFSFTQPLNNMQEVDVMLAPSALSAVPPQWVQVAA